MAFAGMVMITRCVSYERQRTSSRKSVRPSLRPSVCPSDPAYVGLTVRQSLRPSFGKADAYARFREQGAPYPSQYWPRFAFEWIH